MRRLVAVLALAGSLGGCAYYYPTSPAPPPPAPPEPRHPPVDACGAGALQYLVGRPVSELPPYGRREQRVLAQGADYEERFVPERLTVIYDGASGRITRVRCG
jgi:Peptidase inhibitor I78 family